MDRVREPVGKLGDVFTQLSQRPGFLHLVLQTLQTPAEFCGTPRQLLLGLLPTARQVAGEARGHHQEAGLHRQGVHDPAETKSDLLKPEPGDTPSRHQGKALGRSCHGRKGDLEPQTSGEGRGDPSRQQHQGDPPAQTERGGETTHERADQGPIPKESRLEVHERGDGEDPEDRVPYAQIRSEGIGEQRRGTQSHMANERGPFERRPSREPVGHDARSAAR